MGRISTGVGLVSGINSKDIIDQLMSIESQPVTLLQTRIKSVSDQKTAFTDLLTRLTSLRVTATTFKKPSTFQAATAASSDEDVLTATASNGAPIGSFQFQVARLVTAQQSISNGFADATNTKVKAGTITIEEGGGELTSQAQLSQLKGGNGVSRGLFRITDRSGRSTVIDASAAVTLDDVVKKINTSLDVSVKATLSSDGIVLTDGTGRSDNNFIVEDVGDGHAAQDLGISANVASSTITGADINYLSRATTLDSLNDGRGVRTAGGTANDLVITSSDNSTINVSLASAKNLGDVIDAINTAAGGKVTADIAPGANGIRLTDAAAGTLSVAAAGTSNAAADLGILGSATGTLNGNAIQSAFGTVLLSSLKGGKGLTSLGTISIADRTGANTTVNLAGASTVRDILDRINSAAAAAGVGLQASLKGSLNGIQIADTTSGTGNIIVADTGGATTAADLGIAGSFDTSKSAVLGANLQRQWVSDNTLLSSYNAGKGVTAGRFKITNSTGLSATVDLTNGSFTKLKDVISAVNATNIGVTASVNANGDGLLLTDNAGGAAKLKVEDVDSTTAADLNIKGEATAAGASNAIDGTFEKTLTLTGTETLTDAQVAINNLNFGVRATIVNDGGSASPFRLSLNAINAGRSARVVFDAADTGLQTRNLVEAQDAAVFYGSADASQPLLLTSGKNQLTGVIPGVTIDIHGVSTSPVTLNITRNADDLVKKVQSFSDTFNQLVDKMHELTKFDTDTNTPGLLLGDSTVQQIESNVYAALQGVVTGAGRYRMLADVGITLGDEAKITFDEDKFRAAYAADPDSVQKLFTAADAALGADTSLAQINSGRGVRTVGGTTPDFSATLRDGSTVNVALGNVTTLGDVINAINAAGGAKLKADFNATGDAIRLTDTSGGTTSNFSLSSLNGSQALFDLGFSSSPSAGTSTILTGAKVPYTRPASAAAGIGTLLERRLNLLVDPVDGIIPRENTTLDDRTQQFQDRIDSLNQLLADKRTRLEKQFANLESVLSTLQSQQQSLGSLGSVSAPSSSRSK